MRGELRIGFSTKWWYSESGSNKLQAKIRAWQERYLIAVDQLPARIAEKVEGNDDGKVSFRDIITLTPTKKVATLEGVNHLILFHRDFHSIRTSYKYKMKLVSFHAKFFGNRVVDTKFEFSCYHIRAQRRARMTARIERERAMRAYANALCFGMGKKVVVVLGDKDVTKHRYYRPRPHREFVRVLSDVTNVIIVGEYYTSKKAGCCAQRKLDGGDAWNKPGPGDIVRHL